MRKILLIIASAVLLAGCNESPSDSYKKFTTSLEKGDLNAAFGIVDASSRALIESRGGVTKLNESAEFIKSHKGIKEIKVLSEEKSGNVASSKVTVVFNDGFSGEIQNKFTKEDGTWKLSIK